MQRPRKLIDAFRGLKLESPRGPIEIDAYTRDIVQTVYIRRTERRNGRWINREFERFEKVRDPALKNMPRARSVPDRARRRRKNSIAPRGRPLSSIAT